MVSQKSIRELAGLGARALTDLPQQAAYCVVGGLPAAAAAALVVAVVVGGSPLSCRCAAAATTHPSSNFHP